MLEQLSGIIIHLIQSAGYLGVFGLMVLNATAIPIPSEVTLPFAGFLANQGSLSLIFIIAVGVLGDLVGSIIGYTIGFFLEENLLLRLIKKFGKLVLVTEHDYILVTGLIKRFGVPFVFVGKMLPGFKSFVAIAAGITEVKFTKFIISNVLAALIYVSFVSYVGFYLGSKWNILGGYFQKFELVIVVLVILAGLFYVNYKLKIVKFRK
ncbi:MAG TPA: DedA family protein [Patescibacteria group bacterium]|jgi:membrane protein DedA with SNARE-associated domain|nr:DedA family protein [Patescibacteria group bacterium]